MKSQNTNDKIKLESRIKSRANHYYNMGLEKAQLKEMTSAMISLKKSLMYNKRHVQARNLLGLILFEVGEIGEAKKHWLMSKSIDPAEENQACDYLKKLEGTNRALDKRIQCIKIYNEALNHINNNSEDYAIIKLKKVVATNPSFIKAQNLLALCYLKRGDYNKAEKITRIVLKIDKSNVQALHYKNMIELEQEDDENAGTVSQNQDFDSKIQERQTQPRFFRYGQKEKSLFAPVSQIVLFLLGVFCGGAALMTLYFPDKTNNLEAQIGEIKTEYSKQATLIQQKDERITELLEQAKALNKDLEDSNEDQDKAELSVLQNDALNKSVIAYIEGNKQGAAENLLSISPSELTSQGIIVYNNLKDELYPEMASYYYKEGHKYYSSNVDKALELFSKSVQYTNKGYQHDESMYFIARCYQKLGQEKESKEYFERFLNEYSGKKTDKRYIDGDYYLKRLNS